MCFWRFPCRQVQFSYQQGYLNLKFVDLVLEEKSRCCSRVFHCHVDGWSHGRLLISIIFTYQGGQMDHSKRIENIFFQSCDWFRNWFDDTNKLSLSQRNLWLQDKISSLHTQLSPLEWWNILSLCSWILATLETGGSPRLHLPSHSCSFLLSDSGDTYLAADKVVT